MHIAIHTLDHSSRRKVKQERLDNPTLHISGGIMNCAQRYTYQQSAVMGHIVHWIYFYLFTIFVHRLSP